MYQYVYSICDLSNQAFLIHLPSSRNPRCVPWRKVLRLVGRSVRRARGGVILKSTTNSGGLL
jgi:hypothetical protein